MSTDVLFFSQYNLNLEEHKLTAMAGFNNLTRHTKHTLFHLSLTKFAKIKFENIHSLIFQQQIEDFIRQDNGLAGYMNE